MWGQILDLREDYVLPFQGHKGKGTDCLNESTVGTADHERGKVEVSEGRAVVQIKW